MYRHMDQGMLVTSCLAAFRRLHATPNSTRQRKDGMQYSEWQGMACIVYRVHQAEEETKQLSRYEGNFSYGSRDGLAKDPRGCPTTYYNEIRINMPYVNIMTQCWEVSFCHLAYHSGARSPSLGLSLRWLSDLLITQVA